MDQVHVWKKNTLRLYVYTVSTYIEYINAAHIYVYANNMVYFFQRTELFNSICSIKKI